MATVFETSNLTARARAIDARIHKMQDEGQLQRLHCAVIKDIGPSCVNRDMSGEQKTITYGGVRRMFVSSQSIWQRPRQDELNDVFRTRRIALYMNSRLRKDLPGHSDEWYNYAASTASPSKDSSKDAEDKKEPLATYSEADVEEMVAIIRENFQPSSEKKEDLEKEAKRVQGIMQKAMKETAMERAVNVSIASFGRMSTDERFNTIYGSMYRSHAIGISCYTDEFNDYSATDQYLLFLKQAGLDQNAVGMLETDNCNTGLLLFQFIDDPAIFIRNILRGQDINDEAVWERAVKLCNETQAKRIHQLVNYIPSGKQHSYATNPVPLLVVCTFTNGMAHTLEGAFADPVTATKDTSFEENAVNKLVDYLDDDTFYDPECDRVTRLWVAGSRFKNAPKGAKRTDLKGLLSLVRKGEAYAHD